MSSEQERVTRGAAWLDDVKPGWFTIIDLTTLDLGYAYRCVAGQVFASEAAESGKCCGFCYATRTLRDDGVDDPDKKYGFVAAGSDLWVKAIAARRSVAA